MKAITLLLIVLMLVITHTASSQQETSSLVVLVVSGDGTPKPGLTVSVQAENFRETSVTNASGYAVFRQLTPGTYDITVSLRNIELIKRKVEFPDTDFVSVTAPLAALTVKVTDVSKRFVQNILVNLTSPNGAISSLQRTNSSGYAVFTDVPFSTVPSIGGPYKLAVVKDGLAVGVVERYVQSFSEFVELEAKLVNVNFTMTDIGGRRAEIDGSLSLLSGNYSQTVEIRRGVGQVSQLISTQVVGKYNASFRVILGEKDVLVHSSIVNIESDAEIVLKADLAELVVRVVDPSNQPMKGIGILVGAAGYGNFSSGLTDSDGTFSVGLVPTSNRVQEYQISVFRGRTRLLVERLALNEPKTTKQIALPLQRIVFNVLDYRETPLSNVVVVVKDQVTGRTVNASTVNGVASAEVFPGANEVSIIYKQTTVFRRIVELKEGTETIRLQSVNFPVRVIVTDSLGRPIENLKTIVRSQEKVLLDGFTGSAPLEIELELPAEIVIDLHSGQNLLARERRAVDGPTDIEVRFTDFIVLGGLFLPVNMLFTAAFALIVSVLTVMLFLRKQKMKQR